MIHLRSILHSHQLREDDFHLRRYSRLGLMFPVEYLDSRITDMDTHLDIYSDMDKSVGCHHIRVNMKQYSLRRFDSSLHIEGIQLHMLPFHGYFRYRGVELIRTGLIRTTF